MIGAIIGDIVGSRFEFYNHRSKEFELFTENCFVTDDSIMTLSVAKAIMETEKQIQPALGGLDLSNEYYTLLEKMTVKQMQKIGQKYPYCGYGGMFSQWIVSSDPKPYNSYGNGAAMRISPVGFAGRTESEIIRLSETITGVSHNHEEGLKGAEAVAIAIYMARTGYRKSEIRDRITRDYYSLDFTIDEIRDTYQFNETCQDTVPQAIVAFLESTSFEDAIRIAISVGGDSDTMAAITGAIAEGYYGVPSWIREKALSFLDEELLAIYNDWQLFLGQDAEVSKYHVLTKYIGSFSELESYVEFIREPVGDDSFSFPYQMSYSDLTDIIKLFADEFLQFLESRLEYQLTSSGSFALSSMHSWEHNSFKYTFSDALNEDQILSILLDAVKSQRTDKHHLIDMIKDGSLLKLLKKLKTIESKNLPKTVKEIYFENGGYSGFDRYHIYFSDQSARLVKTQHPNNLIPSKIQYTPEETKEFLDRFRELHVECWKNEYTESSINNETYWTLAVKLEGSRGRVWSGSSAYPSNWDDLLTVFGIEPDHYEDDDDDDDINNTSIGE